MAAHEIDEEVKIMICNTMVKHALATGEYNLRRVECEACVRAEVTSS